MAIDIYNSRIDYLEISNNPLKIKEKQEEKIIVKKEVQLF